MNLSAIENNNNTQQKRQVYIPARIKVIEVTARNIVCQSGNQRMDWQDLGDGGFEEQFVFAQQKSKCIFATRINV